MNWTPILKHSFRLLYSFIVVNGFETYESHLEFNLVFILCIPSRNKYFHFNFHLQNACNFLCNKIFSLSFQNKLCRITFIFNIILRRFIKFVCECYLFTIWLVKNLIWTNKRIKESDINRDRSFGYIDWYSEIRSWCENEHKNIQTGGKLLYLRKPQSKI